MFLFLGFIVSFSIWNVMLPGDVSKKLFNTQLKDIENVESTASPVTGDVMNDTPILGVILVNNVLVLLFSLLSFFYRVFMLI